MNRLRLLSTQEDGNERRESVLRDKLLSETEAVEAAVLCHSQATDCLFKRLCVATASEQLL